MRRADADVFPCAPGPVERVYNFDYCCQSEILVIATDGRGVTSDQYNGTVEFARPDRPVYAEGTLSGWREGGTVKIQFYTVAAPGDDPKGDVRIYQVPDSGAGTSADATWCQGPNILSFTGPPGYYQVDLTITSDAYPFPQMLGQMQVLVE